MSGVVDAIGDVFDAAGDAIESVVDTVVDIAPYIVMGAAVYFTAGLALSAFPATAGFAASMPGFAGGGLLGTGIGSGATAGTGLFSQAATAIGLGGGIQAGAAAATTASTAATAAATAAPVSGTLAKFGAQGASVASTMGGGAPAAASAAGMSFGDKLMLAAVGSQAVGAFLAPSLDDQYRDAAKFRGAFYGSTAPGGKTVTPEAPMPTTPSQVQGASPQPTGVEAPAAGSSGGLLPEKQAQAPAKRSSGLLPVDEVKPSKPNKGVLFPKKDKVKYVV